MFLNALPKVAPLEDSDRAYAAILRAAALIMTGKLREAEASLGLVATPTDGWVSAGATCVRAELALAKGDVALATTLAQTVLDTWSSDHDCIDEVARAQAILTAHG